METKTQQEATSALLGIQNLIREKNDDKLFGFIFKLSPKGEFVLSVTSDFIIEFKDKHLERKIFSGPDFIKIVNDFLTFFTEEGGRGEIIASGNKFKANFHYENNWVVDNVSNGPYLNRSYD